VTGSIRKALLMLAARWFFDPKDLRALSDDDLEAGLNLYPSMQKAINETSEALGLIFETELEERVGRAISKIRSAEGIDPDQIDQILGVERVDL